MNTQRAELPKAYEYKVIVGLSLFDLANMANREFEEGWQPSPDLTPVKDHHGGIAITLRREVPTFTVAGNPSDPEPAAEREDYNSLLMKTIAEYEACREKSGEAVREFYAKYGLPCRRLAVAEKLGAQAAAEVRTNDDPPPVRGGRPVDDDGIPVADNLGPRLRDYSGVDAGRHAFGGCYGQ